MSSYFEDGSERGERLRFDSINAGIIDDGLGSREVEVQSITTQYVFWPWLQERDFGNGNSSDLYNVLPCYDCVDGESCFTFSNWTFHRPSTPTRPDVCPNGDISEFGHIPSPFYMSKKIMK